MFSEFFISWLLDEPDDVAFGVAHTGDQAAATDICDALQYLSSSEKLEQEDD